jgi:molybdate-binding protein
LHCTVVTFAHWEEGIIVRRGNPKTVRTVADLTRPAIRLINREQGSGARRLLDRELRSAGIPTGRIRGYRMKSYPISRLRLVSKWLGDAGIGAMPRRPFMVSIYPLQRERYDLVIPKAHYESLQSLRTLLDLIVSKPFRDELEALGGYDTRDTGKLVAGTGETLR